MTVPRLVPTAMPGEVFRDLPARIRDHAALRPEADALIDGAERLSWADLADRMDRIAGNLAAQGVGAGGVVASLAGVTADHVALFLGTVAAGAAIAPLPVSAHPDAVARMIANSGAALVLADERAPEVPGTSSLPAFLGEAMRAAPLPPRSMGPDDLFDIIYSSGTTGAPKGIEHDARFRDRQIARFHGLGFGPEAVTLISTPIYSNTTLVTLVPALGTGGAVVLQRRFDEADWLRLAEAERVTHTMLVPVQLQRLLAHEDFDRRDLSAFVAKLSTSAPLPAPLKREILARWPGRMIGIYGMTEGGVSAILDCGAHPGKLHTVGRPVAGAEVRVIDPAGRALPPGEVGEVVGRSPTVMLGYRGAPEATAAAIWVSPEGEPFLRTGDLGRLDADGFLELLDRQKDVIISGGFNVFASDLEAVLLEHPAVADAAVIGVPSERWGETPLGCIALKSDMKEHGILDWANGRLGRTQRLSAIAVLPELPRNAIGKVLRRELRERWAEGRLEPARV